MSRARAFSVSPSAAVPVAAPPWPGSRTIRRTGRGKTSGSSGAGGPVNAGGPVKTIPGSGGAPSAPGPAGEPDSGRFSSR